MSQAKFFICIFLVLFQLYCIVHADPEDTGTTQSTTPSGASGITTKSASKNEDSQTTKTSDEKSSTMFTNFQNMMSQWSNMLSKGVAGG